MSDLEKVKKQLQEAIEVQTSDGVWNSDAYMHGMANGLLFCMSLFDGKEPEYLKAPLVWLSDLRDTVETLEQIDKQ